MLRKWWLLGRWRIRAKSISNRRRGNKAVAINGKGEREKREKDNMVGKGYRHAVQTSNPVLPLKGEGTMTPLTQRGLNGEVWGDEPGPTNVNLTHIADRVQEEREGDAEGVCGDPVYGEFVGS